MANLGTGKAGSFLLSVSIQALRPDSELFHQNNLGIFDFPIIAPIIHGHHSTFSEFLFIALLESCQNNCKNRHLNFWKNQHHVKR